MAKAEEVIAQQLQGDLLSKRLRELSSQLRKDLVYAAMLDRISPDQRRLELMRSLKQEIVKELALPSFEEWTKANPQSALFNDD